jgi:Ca2+/Na+ antiporter
MNDVYHNNKAEFSPDILANIRYIGFMKIALYAEIVYWVLMLPLYFFKYEVWWHGVITFAPLLVFLVSSFIVYKKEVEILKELIQKSVIKNVLRERGETDPDIEKINSYEQQLHRKHLRLMLPVYILMILIFYGYHLYVYITK